MHNSLTLLNRGTVYLQFDGNITCSLFSTWFGLEVTLFATSPCCCGMLTHRGYGEVDLQSLNIFSVGGAISILRLQTDTHCIPCSVTALQNAQNDRSKKQTTETKFFVLSFYSKFQHGLSNITVDLLLLPKMYFLIMNKNKFFHFLCIDLKSIVITPFNHFVQGGVSYFTEILELCHQEVDSDLVYLYGSRQCKTRKHG